MSKIVDPTLKAELLADALRLDHIGDQERVIRPPRDIEKINFEQLLGKARKLFVQGKTTNEDSATAVSRAREILRTLLQDASKPHDKPESK